MHASRAAVVTARAGIVLSHIVTLSCTLPRNRKISWSTIATEFRIRLGGSSDRLGLGRHHDRDEEEGRQDKEGAGKPHGVSTLTDTLTTVPEAVERTAVPSPLKVQ